MLKAVSIVSRSPGIPVIRPPPDERHCRTGRPPVVCRGHLARETRISPAEVHTIRSSMQTRLPGRGPLWSVDSPQQSVASRHRRRRWHERTDGRDSAKATGPRLIPELELHEFSTDWLRIDRGRGPLVSEERRDRGDSSDDEKSWDDPARDSKQPKEVWPWNCVRRRTESFDPGADRLTPDFLASIEAKAEIAGVFANFPPIPGLLMIG